MSQEVGDIYVSLGLDMSDFNKGVQSLNRQIKEVQSEFQASAAQLSGFGAESQKVRLQADALTKQIDLQKQKIDVYNQALQDSISKAEKHGQALASVTKQLTDAKTQYETTAATMGRNSAEALALADQVKKLEAEYKAKIQTLQSDDKAIDNNRIKLNQAKETLGNLQNELIKTTTATKQAGNNFDSLGSKIRGALVNTALYSGVYFGLNAITSGLKDAASAGIQFDAQMQQNEIGFTTLLGSAQQAQKLLKDLADFAQSTPFDLTGVEQSAKQMLAMGFAAKDLLPDMKAIGDAAAALGLQTDGIQRVTLALGQMRTHGVADAQDMMQLTEAGIPAWDILAKAIGTTIPQLQAMVTKGIVPADKATQALIDGMEQRYPNMLQKMNSSFMSEMGNLKDGLNRDMGDVMKPIFDWLTNTELPKLNEEVNQFRQVLEQTGSVSDALKTIFPPDIVDTITSAVTDVKSLLTLLYDVRGVLVGLGVGFAVFKIGSMVASAAAAIRDLTKAIIALDLAEMANPIGGIAAALGLAVGAVATFRQSWDTNMTDVQQQTDDTAKSVAQLNAEIQQQTTDAQSNIATLTNNINQLQQLKAQYESLQKTLATVKQGTDAYKKAQSDLADVKQQLIGLIGDEATQQLLASNDVVKAWNNEIQTMVQAQITELTATNNRLKAEQNLTNGVVTESNKRIQAMQNEINAMQATQNLYAADNYANGATGDSSLYAVDNYANGVSSAQGNSSNQANVDALSQQQEEIWRRQAANQAAANRANQGPLDDAIAQAKAMLEALQKNNDQMFGSGSSSSSGGGWNLGSGRNSGANNNAKKAGADLVQSYINGIESQLSPLQNTMSQLQARLQFRKDQGNADAVKGTINDMVKAYQDGMNQVQKAMDGINEKIKSMNPKAQAADIAKLKDEYSKLATEWWNDRDAIQQLNNQLKQTEQEAAQAAADAFQQAAQTQLQAFVDAKNAELEAMQKVHEQALANFDSETQAMLASIDTQISALNDLQTAQDRQSQEQNWNKQESDLNHQLDVAQMMNDPKTVKQVQQQLADLHDQMQKQREQWANDDKRAELEQQKQTLQAQRDAERQAMQQMFQDQETAFQNQIQKQQQQLTALIQGLVQAIQDRKLTQDQANAAWVQAIKDNGDAQVQAQIEGQKNVNDALTKWVQSYVDLGRSYGKSLGDGVVTGLQSMLGAVQSAAAQLRNAAASAMSLASTSISGSGTVAFHLPALATGGIFTGPAIVGEGKYPEAAIPLDNGTMSRLAAAITSQMRGGTSSQGSPQQINLYLSDGNKIAEWVWEYGTSQALERQRKG